MTDFINKVPDGIEVPLRSKDLVIADQIAFSHSSPAIQESIFLNVLAVLASHRYLRKYGIQSDLERSRSFNLAVQTTCETGNLLLPGVGRIECIPVLPSETVVKFNRNIDADVIAYVVIQVEEMLAKPKLLGYVLNSEAVLDKQLSFSELRPGDQLIDFLQSYKPHEEENPSPQLTNVISLSQWVSRKSQQPETMTRLAQAANATHADPSSRQERVELEIESILLSKDYLKIDIDVRMTILQKGDDRYRVFIELHPHDEKERLPQGVGLTIVGGRTVQNQTLKPEEMLTAKPIQMGGNTPFTYRITHDSFSFEEETSVEYLLRNLES